MAAATNWFPSAEQATEVQFSYGAVAVVQVVPESLETKMEPPVAATNVDPSAEHARAAQCMLGMGLTLQVAPESAEV